MDQMNCNAYKDKMNSTQSQTPLQGWVCVGGNGMGVEVGKKQPMKKIYYLFKESVIRSETILVFNYPKNRQCQPAYIKQP